MSIQTIKAWRCLGQKGMKIVHVGQWKDKESAFREVNEMHMATMYPNDNQVFYFPDMGDVTCKV